MSNRFEVGSPVRIIATGEVGTVTSMYRTDLNRVAALVTTKDRVTSEFWLDELRLVDGDYSYMNSRFD